MRSRLVFLLVFWAIASLARSQNTTSMPPAVMATPPAIHEYWRLETPTPPWAERSGHTMVVHDGRMYVLGGLGAHSLLNSVWYTSNGSRWTRATASAQWSPRTLHASVVYDGKIWVIGGRISGADYLGDVYSSTNGADWTTVTTHADWGPRSYHKALAFDGKMWVIGGFFADSDSSEYYRDIWNSTDGEEWTGITPDTGWGPRIQFSAAVYAGKMWVMGGRGAGFYNDVWNSSDGEHWTRVTESAAWAPRYGHTSVAFQGKIWILGGNSYNEVWYSSGGAWKQATRPSPWAQRVDHASEVFNNRMWIAGGYSYGEPVNDVWYSGFPTSAGLWENY